MVSADVQHDVSRQPEIHSVSMCMVDFGLEAARPQVSLSDKFYGTCDGLYFSVTRFVSGSRH